MLGLTLGLAVSAETGEVPVRFGHLGLDQGLSSNWVLAVLRDSHGFLWIGTQSGLNRYDGRTFVTYRSSKEDPNSLPSSIAGVLFEDSRGRLWVGSRWGVEGVARYDRVLDRFVRVPHGPGSGGLEDGRVNAMAEDSRGRLWVGTRSGVERIDTDEGSHEVFPFGELEPGRASPRMVVSLLQSRSGRLWVGTTEGLFILEERRGHCVPWRGSGDKGARLLRDARIEDLLEDSAGSIWVATISRGLFEIDSPRHAVRHYQPDPADPESLSHSHVRCLEEDRDGRLWVGTENGGLDLLDRRSRRFRRFLPDPLNPHALGSASIYALHRDAQGILWIGTYNSGVGFVAPSEQRFGLVGASPQGLRDPHVSAFLEDRRGNLWIGTDGGGLARVDAATGRYTHFLHAPNDPHSIGSNSILTLLEAEDGTIWLGGWDAGLTRLDPRTRRSRSYRHKDSDPASIVGNDVWRVRRLPSGELLVATQVGADVFDPDTGRFQRLDDRFPAVRHTMTFTAEVTKEGGLWIGQSGVAQHVDLDSGRVVTYEHSPTDPESLPSGMVFSILQDSAGHTWIGTEGGLVCLPGERRLGSKLLHVKGLPHETVTNILEDSLGGIWVTTHRGLSWLKGAVRDPAQPTLVHFDVSDGLQAGEFTRGASLKARDGRLYVGGPRGYNVFRPEDIRLNPTPPPVVLTDLRLFNNSLLPGLPGSPLTRAVSETRSISLSQDQYVLTFEFAALNLDLPQKNHYAYRLEGLESAWNDVGTRHEATYTQLRPGHYVFRVRASNNDGLWNDEGLAIQLHVLPWWYERWWARALFVGLAGLLAVVGYRWRVRQLRRRERDLSRRVRDRTRALDQLNEELELRVVERTAELEAEKERLSVTLRSIGDGVIATDVQSHVVLMNRVAEELTGWKVEAAQGRPLKEVLQLFDVKSRQPLPHPGDTLLQGAGPWPAPVQGLLVRPDGTERILSQGVAAIRDRSSRSIGVVIALRDVTDESKVEEQLQNSQKLEALGILAGGIAHDFNNLLTGVFGYLDLTCRRWAGRPKEVAALRKALAVVERARGLTGQLLTFSRGGEPIRAPLDLTDLLRKSVDFALSGSNVVCELRLADDLWTCEGDQRQIDQVVDNLLLNARQAMPNGGTVVVAAENVLVGEETRLPLEAGRYVKVTVRDEGVGIPPEIRSRIFEPFFSTKAQGTGLGLATSYSIVRKHGGHIDVTATPGKGTGFTFWLPASLHAAAAQDQPADRASVRPCRVLVMDDEEYVRDVVCEMLEQLGHSAEAVADGHAAVEAFRRAHEAGRSFDTVMLDLTIPGGAGGLAVLARLKEIDPQVRAVASSGYSRDPVMADPARHGFAAQLTKPYTVEDLARVMGTVAVEAGGES